MSKEISWSQARINGFGEKPIFASNIYSAVQGPSPLLGLVHFNGDKKVEIPLSHPWAGFDDADKDLIRAGLEFGSPHFLDAVYAAVANHNRRAWRLQGHMDAVRRVGVIFGLSSKTRGYKVESLHEGLGSGRLHHGSFLIKGDNLTMADRGVQILKRLTGTRTGGLETVDDYIRRLNRLKGLKVLPYNFESLRIQVLSEVNKEK